MDVTVDFSSEEASRLSLVPVQRLQEWERTGFLTASIPAKRRGVSRRYTFRDVIALRVAAELRESGVSLQMLRRVVDYLRAREGLSGTDVLARTNLVTSGEQLYEVAGDVTLHLPSGQRMMVHMTIPLDQIVREVQRKAHALRRAA